MSQPTHKNKAKTRPRKAATGSRVKSVRVASTVKPPRTSAGKSTFVAHSAPKTPAKTPARSPRRTAQRTSILRLWWLGLAAFLGRNRREVTAFALLALGALLLLTIVLSSPSYIEILFGWTAALVALTLAGVGIVMLLGKRVGYWSAEALIGIELLLIALQAGTFVAANEAVTYVMPRDGSQGGIVGTAIGSLLVGGFGRNLAILFLALVAVAGVLLLVRYTPLIFGVARLAWHAPVWSARLRRLAQRTAHLLPLPARAQHPAHHGEHHAAPNFVTPERTADEQDPAHIRPAAGVTFIPPEPVADAPPAAAPVYNKATRKRKPAKTETITSGPAIEGAVALPPTDILARDSGAYSVADVLGVQRRIESTLEDFDVPVKVVHVESGPTVTQFGVEPQFVERAGQRRKIRVSRIVALADDLALALAAPAVRIEAPVPGRPYVGIEVPNEVKTVVGLRPIMESAELAKDGGKLALPLGRNTSGAPIVMDLTRAPHMLIAGSTGSGKSVCINSIVTGLLMRHAPDTLRFVMVDPKRVELTGYNGIPHLMDSVITDVEMVMPALTWLLVQMDDRYRLFREVGVRNIDSYNAWVRSHNEGAPDASQRQTLPFIVLIVDELADLMMTAAEDIERQLCRLAQMARATGIHLILATQRPSVDVVTGLIKANFPTRVAFAVTSSTDSRVILDSPGAERLLGRGDMLLMKPDLAKLLRVQGCLVTDEEITRVTDFWKKQPQTQPRPARAPWADLVGRDEESDDLLERAITALTGLPTCSTSMLQRKLRIGYPRAARLMDQLEEMGAVGPDQGSGLGREVRIRTDDDAESGTGDAPSADNDHIEWTDAIASPPIASPELENLPPFLRK